MHRITLIKLMFAPAMLNHSDVSVSQINTTPVHTDHYEYRQCPKKKISDIIDCKLKKDYQFLIGFW